MTSPSTTTRSEGEGSVPTAKAQNQEARRPRGGTAQIRFVIAPTRDGVRDLLDGIAKRLPNEAPIAPRRKGVAWQEGFMAGITHARGMLAWVGDGVQLRNTVAPLGSAVEQDI